MKIKTLGLKNFKAFESVNLNLSNINVLIGENSSGKTTILQSLLLLKQTIENSPSVGTLALTGPDYGIDFTFPEMVYGRPGANAPDVSFNLGFDDFTVSFSVGAVQKGGIVLKEFKLDDNPYENLSERKFFMPEAFLYSVAGTLFNDFFLRIGYLGPIRKKAERAYVLRGTSPSWIGTQGEFIADYLDSHNDVKKKVIQWFTDESGLASAMKFKPIQAKALMEILLTEPTSGLEINIAQLGFGFSQLLPMITGAYVDEVDFLIYEGPEIHLNPRLHGLLTDAIVKASKQGKQILIETHSEHIIYRLQTLVAQKVISKDDVAIYYMNRPEALRLELDDEGEIPNWPEGFFEADIQDIMQRVAANYEQKK
jgi:predicted ATPase